jgi:hypothetical protein
MRKLSIKLNITTVLIALLITTSTKPAEANDKRFRVYKSDPFGNKEDALNPDAVIKIDRRTGRGFIYDADPFGNPDTFNGPQYVIERDKHSAFNNLLDSDEPCDDELWGEDRGHIGSRHRLFDD